MSKNEWFIIKDLEGFIDSTRILVFNNFGKQQEDDQKDIVSSFNINTEDEKELDLILSFNESQVIVKPLLKKQYNKKSNKIRYLLNDNIYLKILSDLNDRMISNILSGLVKKGVVETAYDDQINDFVFWIKDNNDKEKPETD